MNRLESLHEAGVSIWLDTLSRELLVDGGFAELIAGSSVTGATSNPTIFAKAITGSDRYDRQLRDCVESGVSGARELFFELALDDAEIGPADVGYINAHGTSTPLNDRSETESLKTALGDYARRVPVSSTKSAIGHLLGAAGAVEAIATVQALGRRTAPPTLGWAERDEGLDLDYVPGEARALDANGNGAADDPLVAISNSFGFGGHNAVLCVRA